MDGLAESHFISENSVDAVLEQADHPVEAADLVVAHRAVLDVRRRLVKARHRFIVVSRDCQYLLVVFLL